MRCEQEVCHYWTGDGCACATLDLDPYDKVVFVQGHRHGEPVCAWPDRQAYLTPEHMAAMPSA